jgi:MerR family transcriptional regulator, copper efflux regulator
MKIGELAKLTGVSIDALRFYEEKSLIQPVGRTESGYRLYTPSTVAQVTFLKTAQELGFSLQEIADVMPALTEGNLPLGEVLQRMQAKLQALDEQIERLQTLRQQLVSTLASFKCDAQVLLNPQDLTRPKPSRQK